MNPLGPRAARPLAAHPPSPIGPPPLPAGGPPALSGWRDALLVGALFAGTVLYWTSLPHSLQAADESVHLYEAKRVLNGEVLYRDVFNFIPPGWFYLMAALFAAFGTSIDTARIAMAVMHGLTVALIHLTCRRLGVRRSLAWPPALAYVVICQSAWPIVSQHWVSTLCCTALLFVCAGRAERPRWALSAGVVLGLLIGVQQQRGVFMGAGLGVWLLADWLLCRRYAAAPPLRVLLTDAAAVTAGVALVVVPLLAIAAATAGVGAVWNALVIFPLFNYRSEMHCAWGAVNFLTGWYARFTFPRILKYLPVVLLLSAARLVLLSLGRHERGRARALLLLLIFSAASALSIAYFPDFIKISFITSIFLVAAAENLEWLAGAIPGRRRAVQGLGWIAAAVFLIAGGRHLYMNRVQLRQAYPVRHATAFGAIDFASQDEARLRDTLDELLAGAPSRALYGYPIVADIYLTVPADNPTPYGFFLAFGYHSPAQVQQVIDILAARKLPYIVAVPGLLKPEDPVFRYILREYEPLSPTPLAGRVIYRRKPSL